MNIHETFQNHDFFFEKTKNSLTKFQKNLIQLLEFMKIFKKYNESLFETHEQFLEKSNIF
jgi:hypothetical protein